MLFAVILAILLFSLVLIKSADISVLSIKKIGGGKSSKSFVLSAIILAVATSFPEMFVGITSALEGNPSISLGDITGSNVANISLIVGIAGLVVGSVRVNGNFFKRDVWIALFAGILPSMLLLDGNLSRVDGLILLSIYFAYATGLYWKRYEQIAESGIPEHKLPYRFIRTLNSLNHINSTKKREYSKLFIGIALMLFSADTIVRLASNLAEEMGVDTFVVGLVIVAIGTSLPEFAFSIRSLRLKESSMFLGNILGSTIANSTLILGIVSVISPIHVDDTNRYFMAMGMFVIIFLTLWFFIKSKFKLERWESFVLLIMYLIFVSFVLVV